MAEAKNGPGRPEFEVTDELRDKVEWYIATGMTQEEVARAISCTIPTLTKHFSDNIENGWARKKAETVDLMVATAKDGNASLVKHLDKTISTFGAMHKFDSPPPGEPQSRPAAPLGKKEIAQIEAKTAGGGDTGWGNLLQGPPTRN